MNRRLQDPFKSHELPEVIEEYLEHGHTLCAAFNRRGTLLATGNKEGQVAIWDFETRGLALELSGHDGPVTSVCWSRNGRYLLSGSEDQRVVLWNVADGTSEAGESLGCAVQRVSLSETPPYRCVASLAEGPPVLIDFEAGTKERLPLVVDGEAAGPGASSKVKSEQAGSSSSGGGVAVLSRCGSMVLVGQGRGVLVVLDVHTRQVLDMVKCAPSARVTGLQLSRKGDLLLANCADRVMRLYSLGQRHPPLNGQQQQQAHGQQQQEQQQQDQQQGREGQQRPVFSEAQARAVLQSGKKAPRPGASLLYDPTQEANTPGQQVLQPLLVPLKEFQNAVERQPWSAACFSGDGEHVVAAGGAGGAHTLYLWSRPLGALERILDGPKEGVVAVSWHPLRGLLLSISAKGCIYVWAKAYAENWSAFAPGFKELDENVEYVEREDEFDWNTPGCGGEAEGGEAAGLCTAGDESAVIDVLSRDPEAQRAFSSDDEDDPLTQLHYLPVVIEPEARPQDLTAVQQQQQQQGQEEVGATAIALMGDGGAQGQQALDAVMYNVAQPGHPGHGLLSGNGQHDHSEGPGGGDSSVIAFQEDPGGQKRKSVTWASAANGEGSLSKRVAQ